MTVQRRYTSADLDILPEIEGIRYEIIDGELFVSKQPSVNHHHPCTVLTAALYVWSTSVGHGFVYATAGLVFPDDDDVAPDLIWISQERLVAGRDTAGHITVGPELAIESVSPGQANERRDREIKLALYSRRGVDEYWIVDSRRHEVQVFRRGASGLELAETLGDGDTLTSPMLPGCSVRVITLWQPV